MEPFPSSVALKKVAQNAETHTFEQKKCVKMIKMKVSGTPNGRTAESGGPGPSQAPSRAWGRIRRFLGSLSVGTNTHRVGSRANITAPTPGLRKTRPSDPGANQTDTGTATQQGIETKQAKHETEPDQRTEQELETETKQMPLASKLMEATDSGHYKQKTTSNETRTSIGKQAKHKQTDINKNTNKRQSKSKHKTQTTTHEFRAL